MPIKTGPKLNLHFSVSYHTWSHFVLLMSVIVQVCSVSVSIGTKSHIVSLPRPESTCDFWRTKWQKKKQVSVPVRLFSPVIMILPIIHTHILCIYHWYGIALLVKSVVKQTRNLKSFVMSFYQYHARQLLSVADLLRFIFCMWKFTALLTVYLTL